MRSGTKRGPFIPNGIMRLRKDIVNQREDNETTPGTPFLGNEPNSNGDS